MKFPRDNLCTKKNKSFMFFANKILKYVIIILTKQELIYCKHMIYVYYVFRNIKSMVFGNESLNR